MTSASPQAFLKFFPTSPAGSVITAIWENPLRDQTTQKPWVPCQFTLRRSLRDAQYSLRGPELQRLGQVCEDVCEVGWPPSCCFSLAMRLLFIGSLLNSPWPVSREGGSAQRSRGFTGMEPTTPRSRISGRVSQTGVQDPRPGASSCGPAGFLSVQVEHVQHEPMLLPLVSGSSGSPQCPYLSLIFSHQFPISLPKPKQN